MIRRAVLTIAVSALTLAADPPRPVTETIPDFYTPVPNDLQRLGGMLASRMRANTEGYLEHIRVKQIAQALEAANGHDAGSASDGTMGRSAGLLLEAAANSYEYSDDAQLKGVMDGIAKALIANQQGDGYIGSYPAARRWSHEDLSAQGAILLGLVTYSRVTGNEQALVASKRLANPLVTHLSRGKGAVADAREIVRPLLELYRATNDGHYLAFCRRLAGSALSEVGAEKDSYSFLLYLSGLADLFQLTGDEAYVKAAESGWKRVRDEELAVTGVPLGKEGSDTGCLTQAWLRLNLDLLIVRGSARYAEQLERTVYNQLLASQDADSGKIDACVPAEGSKKPTLKVDPCTASVSLGISEIPEIVWGRLGAGVAVVSYQPGHATLRLHRRATLQLYTESSYPSASEVLLHVEPSHDVTFPLQLFVPSWTKSFRAEIGATKMLGKPGEFLTLQREWKKGDTVRIFIDMTAAAINDRRHPGEMAIQHGPQVLVLTHGDGPATDLATAAFPATRLSLQADDENDDTYVLLGTTAGKPAKLTLLPFADADAAYRLWIKTSE